MGAHLPVKLGSRFLIRLFFRSSWLEKKTPFPAFRSPSKQLVMYFIWHPAVCLLLIYSPDWPRGLLNAREGGEMWSVVYSIFSFLKGVVLLLWDLLASAPPPLSSKVLPKHTSFRFCWFLQGPPFSSTFCVFSCTSSGLRGAADPQTAILGQHKYSLHPQTFLLRSLAPSPLEPHHVTCQTPPCHMQTRRL